MRSALLPESKTFFFECLTLQNLLLADWQGQAPTSNVRGAGRLPRRSSKARMVIEGAPISKSTVSPCVNISLFWAFVSDCNP